MLNADDLTRLEGLFDGHYRLLKMLNTDGATADVWLAADLNTIETNTTGSNDESSAMLVALKIYRPKNALDVEGEQRFRTEYKIAHECRHPNLLPPEGFSIFNGMPYLIIPYCEAGSAEQLIGKPQTIENVWKFIADVASGLDRLHTNQPVIIHQDIKPANILIDSNGNYAITDFGISSKSNKGIDGYDGNNGTMAYMAPERFDYESTPIPQSDIWAFGATLCEILTGSVPFGEEGGLGQKKKNQIQAPLSHLPANIRELIQSCLQFNPLKRPSARAIMETAQARRTSRTHIKTIVAISLALLLIAGIILFSVTGKSSAPSLYTYEQVEQMLRDKETGVQGKHLLDSLAKTDDYQAVFLLSRLYFDSSLPGDTLFINPIWREMQNNSGIQTDNKKAHQLLFKAFQLNESDPILLFHLGYDYHTDDDRRGCLRNSDYALWCYEQAEKILMSDNHEKNGRLLATIQEKKRKIENDPDTNHSPVKPTHP